MQEARDEDEEEDEDDEEDEEDDEEEEEVEVARRKRSKPSGLDFIFKEAGTEIMVLAAMFYFSKYLIPQLWSFLK